ncbi:hypothetical protein TNCV_591471 [Trichonephila clavipes]|nr:hypothetical protein TNCV_591471 [Trichonephila clavipes]
MKTEQIKKIPRQNEGKKDFWTSESDSDYRGGLVAALDSGPQEISLYRIGCVSYTPQFIITIHVLYFTNHSSGYSTFQCY